MKLIALSPTDARFSLATHKIIIYASDVAALGAGTTGTLVLFPFTGTFPAGTTVRFAGINLKTPFDSTADASINSLLVEVGDGGSTARLLAQTQLAVDGTEILFAASALMYSYPIADTVDALFTVAGGASPTLAEINIGELEIYLYITDMNRIENIDGFNT